MRREFKWEWPSGKNHDHAIVQFRNYLEDNGFRESVIKTYVFRVSNYLRAAGTNRPDQKAFDSFRQTLHSRGLKRSTLNGYSIAIKAYHKMHGETVTYKFLKVNNQIPYFFDEDNIIKIFNSVKNFKHYVMLNVLFYAMLRVSELAALNDEDVDLERRTIRIVEGKGGRYGLAYINQQCADLLRSYLEMRPLLEIDGHQPLFYTDYKNRWQGIEVSRLFYLYKKKAGINKPGGAHVFARHSPASLMIKNGCDLLTIQHVLRHKSIDSTMRYVHLLDDVKRAKYDQFLRL